MKKLIFIALILCLPLLVGWQSGSWDDGELISDFTLAPVKTFTSQATPDVTGYTYFKTANPNVAIDNFTGSDLQAGKIIVVYSQNKATYDVTSSTIKGGTTDIESATGDVTTFLYDGTYWNVISRMDMTDDLN